MFMPLATFIEILCDMWTIYGLPAPSNVVKQASNANFRDLFQLSPDPPTARRFYFTESAVLLVYISTTTHDVTQHANEPPVCRLPIFTTPPLSPLPPPLGLAPLGPLS
jgi:hypothetical protein